MKIKLNGHKIVFTAISDPESLQDIADLISEAAAEIIADFPESIIEEVYIASESPIKSENLIDEGWVYRRKE